MLLLASVPILVSPSAPPVVAEAVGLEQGPYVSPAVSGFTLVRAVASGRAGLGGGRTFRVAARRRIGIPTDLVNQAGNFPPFFVSPNLRHVAIVGGTLAAPRLLIAESKAMRTVASFPVDATSANEIAVVWDRNPDRALVCDRSATEARVRLVLPSGTVRTLGRFPLRAGGNTRAYWSLGGFPVVGFAGRSDGLAFTNAAKPARRRIEAAEMARLVLGRSDRTARGDLRRLMNASETVETGYGGLYAITDPGDGPGTESVDLLFAPGLRRAYHRASWTSVQLARAFPLNARTLAYAETDERTHAFLVGLGGGKGSTTPLPFGDGLYRVRP